MSSTTPPEQHIVISALAENPLELINLVSNGMSVSEAKKHLGME